ncbi:MAG: hypothetical protein AAB383_04570 [Patescibacteria group bacterium]
MSELPQYDPQEAFERKLDAQQAKAVKGLESTFEQKMAWFERASSDWGELAENSIKVTLGSKAEEVTREIRDKVATQLGELDEVERNQLLLAQETAFGFITKRAELMIEIAAMQYETSLQGDKTVSSDTELAKLREVSTLIERMNVSDLVFQALPQPMQASYLESVGGQFPPDYYSMLEKIRDKEPLSPEDLKELVDRVRKLGGNQNTIEQSSLMIVLGVLTPADRTALLTKMAEEASFPDFDQVVLSMVGSTYVTVLQATEALNLRISKLGEDRKFAEETEKLKETLATVNGESMKKTQKIAMEIRADASEYYSTRQVGHKNRARELMTGERLGSLALTVNGGMTVVANVLMGLHDPLDIPMNPALWLGVAQVGVGLQMSDGLAGLMSTPEGMGAKVLKDDNEEADDRMAEHTVVMKADLNNYWEESHFYANFAERIAMVHKAKKEKFLDSTVPVTLADIGINKKEDLPPDFRPLWEQRNNLEAKISEWASDLALIEGERGQKTTDGAAQRAFIEKARAEVSQTVMSYAPLDPFIYKA